MTKNQRESLTNTNATDYDTDYDMGLNYDSIFKINVITGTQDDLSELTSRTDGTQYDAWTRRRSEERRVHA